MRQRKIKNVEEKIAEYEAWVVRDPAACRGSWRERFDTKAAGGLTDDDTPGGGLTDGGAPAGRLTDDDTPAGGPTSAGGNSEAGDSRTRLYLEIGAGKGQFIMRTAQADPEGLYLAAEGLASVVYRGLEKAGDIKPHNVLFIPEYLRGTGEAFAPGELDGIFLNFSDPWPKARNSKRRLTHAERLESYAGSLAAGGFIKIKTDNDELFDFTLEQAEACMERAGLTIAAVTRDLHSTPFADGYATTEYEEKFMALGKNINYLELRKLGAGE